MGCVKVDIRRIGCTRASLARIPSASVSLVAMPVVQASLTPVCSVGGLYYLRVTPSEPQWITPDMPARYQVRSNTRWNVI